MLSQAMALEFLFAQSAIRFIFQELYGVDMLHKYVWAKVSSVFRLFCQFLI